MFHHSATYIEVNLALLDAFLELLVLVEMLTREAPGQYPELAEIAAECRRLLQGVSLDPPE